VEDAAGNRLRVEVDCSCDTGGHAVTLAPTYEGIWDDPELIALELKVEEPSGSSTSAITSEQAVFETSIDGEVQRVGIRKAGDGGRVVEIVDR